MKKLIILSIVVALMFSGTFVAQAQSPAPGGPFSTAFRVQNLEATAASCSYSFYNSSGSSVYTSATQSVNPGDSLYVYVPGISSLAGGSYSGVVSCDRQVAAVANFSDANSGASHSGISSPAEVWYAPGIYDNYYNYYSNIVVQNTGSTAADVTIEIYAPGSATPVAVQGPQSVPAYAAFSFEQEGLAQLQPNQFYSAKIIGTLPIAAVVNIYGRNSANDQLYSYNPFSQGSPKMFAPIIMNGYYGFDTALVVQNMGAQTANVRVTYTNGKTADYQISSGAAQSIHTPTASGLPRGNTLFGATIESLNDQDITVLVNQSNAYNRASSYTGFASGGTEVRAPIVEKLYYNYNSSVVCQNVGNSPATMSISYAGMTGSNNSQSVIPGGVWQFYTPADPLLASVSSNWIGSATITSVQPIVCVVNQDVHSGLATTMQDAHYAYNAILP